MNNNNVHHIFNGDILLEKLKSFQNLDLQLEDSDFTICRETFSDINLFELEFPALWNSRKEFLSSIYPEVKIDYFQYVVSEFEKLNAIDSKADIYLWFEFDFFCIANLAFCLFYIKKLQLKNRLFWVQPSEKGKGFQDISETQIQLMLENKKQISEFDVNIFTKFFKEFSTQHSLWATIYYGDLAKKYPQISDSVEFVIDFCNREFGECKNHIRLLKREYSDNTKLFTAFSLKFPFLGISDLQFKYILNEIIKEKT